jgi:glycerol-3-phosphate dehydrogenase
MEALTILSRAVHERVIGQNLEEWLWCAEALHAVEHTLCMHLSDFYFRRTPLVLSRRDHGLSFAKAIAETMAMRLGWNKTRELEEINALQNQLQWELAATFSS